MSAKKSAATAAKAPPPTHRVKAVRGASHRIVVFSDEFEKSLLSVDPWAARLVITAFLESLGTQSYRLDFAQSSRMQTAMAAHEAVKPAVGALENRALQWMTHGFRLADCRDLYDALDVLDEIASRVRALNRPGFAGGCLV